jgi:hypothetical protein
VPILHVSAPLFSIKFIEIKKVIVWSGDCYVLGVKQKEQARREAIETPLGSLQPVTPFESPFSL